MSDSLDDDDNPNDVRMSFGDHLEELRSRILRALLATIAVGSVVFWFQDDVVRFVVAPYHKVTEGLRMDSSLKTLGPSDAFFAYMQISLVVAFLIAAPLWMYQFWAFIAVGLYKHERAWIFRFAPLMLGLFVAGVFFGYSVLIPLGLEYLLSFGDPKIVQNWISMSDYLSLFVIMTLILGLMFELPVAMALLAKIGVVGVQGFRDKRRYFILGTFIVSAIVTPPDYISQILMASPTLVLYEFGIFLAWLAQGEERGAIHWAYWRKRGYVLLAIVAILVLAKGPLSSYYAREAIAGKIRTSDEGQTVSYLALFAETRSLELKPTGALEMAEPEKGKETWLVWGDDRAEVVDILFRDDRITKMSEEGETSRFLLQAASQSVAVTRVTARDGAAIVPILIEDAEKAGHDVRVLILRGLEKLTGEKPKGAPLAADASEASAEAALAGWKTWWRDHPDWRLVRGR